MTSHPTTHPVPERSRRRQALQWAGAALAALALPALGQASAQAPAKGQAAKPAGPLMKVWKGPACGCCKDWIALVQAAGFRVEVLDTGNTDARERLGVDIRYGSCHTALVGGYAIEGHVPVREIQRLLRERPQAIGLAAPGMPVGSPGMDGPEYGGRRDPYEVLLLTRGGGSSVYQAYR